MRRSHFYPETIKSQFLKDLQKMKNLGDIQWIFAKTAERKPIKELEKLFEHNNVFGEKFL